MRQTNQRLLRAAVVLLLAPSLIAAPQSKSGNTQSQSPAGPAPDETGSEAVPITYQGKFVDLAAIPKNDSCRSIFVQNLWGLVGKDGKWTRFNLASDPSKKLYPNDLDTSNLPQVNRYMSIKCSVPTGGAVPVPVTVPVIVHASLWKKGQSDGTWNEVSSEWEVYRRMKNGKGVLADGYGHPRADSIPTANSYTQPGPLAWAAKPSLYNDRKAKFVGISCFYDWDGHFLDDATAIRNVTVSYKINTTKVTPDNIADVGAILGGLFPGIITGLQAGENPRSEAKLIAPPNKNDAAFGPLPDSIVPGDRVRVRIRNARQTDYTWAVTDISGAAVKDASIDKYGTLTVSANAVPGTIYKITAKAGATVYTAYIGVSSFLPCILASGDVRINSLPSDIAFTLSVQDTTPGGPQDGGGKQQDEAFEAWPQGPSDSAMRIAFEEPEGEPQKGGKGGNAAGDQTGGQGGQSQGSDCSSTGTSGCSTSHTIRAHGREYWDVGLGLSFLGPKEPQYAPSNPQVQITPKDHAGSVYGFANFYPFAPLGNKTSFYPGLAVGIPVTGKVFYQPFFGLSESVLGWWKHAPIALNVLAGVVYLNQQVSVAKAGGGYQIMHERVTKSMFAVELPISALVGKLKSLGGGSSGGTQGGKGGGSQ